MSAHGALGDDLVLANRILASKGVFDSFGHVSVRSGPDRFLLSRNLAPAQVGSGDVVEYDLDCEPIRSDAPTGYLERFIHGEIYRARSDVGAVVHTHAPALIPFGLVRGARLRCVCHMAGFIGDGAPVFEIRDYAGDSSDLLIRSRKLGEGLARDLGDAALILMRGHGATVVASDLQNVVLRAIYSELNARLQASASLLGEVVTLTSGEATAADNANRGQISRAWRNWVEETKNFAAGRPTA
jgi:HCOMODA/2-hydroxy-3-carboxy-muconic semialdehyde decarboxylase